MFWHKKKEPKKSAADAPTTIPNVNEEENKPERIAPSPPPAPKKEVDPDLLAYKNQYQNPGPLPNGADDIELDSIPKLLAEAFYPEDGKNHTCRMWTFEVQDCGEKSQVLDESYYYKKDPGSNDSLYDMYKFIKSLLDACPRLTHKGHEAGGSIATGEGGVTEFYQSADGHFFELWYDYDECWGDSIKFVTRTDALGRLMIRELRSIFEDCLGVPLRVTILPGSMDWWWRKIIFSKADSTPKQPDDSPAG